MPAVLHWQRESGLTGQLSGPGLPKSRPERGAWKKSAAEAAL
jgi:hypothetical protein